MELRGDAPKIATYGRRPIPRRTDTIGPWLDILTFLTWQGALINSALVYLFYRGTTNPVHSESTAEFLALPLSASFMQTVRNAVFPAVLIAMTSSHMYLLVCALVKHVLVRAVWRNNPVLVKLARSEKDVKRLEEVGVATDFKGQSRKRSGRSIR